MNIDVGKKAIAEATEKLKNWGRWGKDDQIGTLNHVTPEDIVSAAGLIRTGKVFALGIPLDRGGPQTGLFGGRWNPIHTMLATGTDAVAGRYDKVLKLRYADDAINMPVQAATHWDLLGHIFYEDKMYNGFDAREVDCNGLGKLGIEHTKSKMVGRGVLLDVARFRGVDWLKDGDAIGNDELDRCAKEAEHRNQARRLRHPAHRTNGAVSEGKELGRLCRRRCAGRQIRELLLVPGQGDRRHLLRYLGRRGAAERRRAGALADARTCQWRSRPAARTGERDDPRHPRRGRPRRNGRCAMTQIAVTIAGRVYRMACDPGGEEARLETFSAAEFDKRIADMRGSFGEMGDQRLIVMAAITLADELNEAKRKTQMLEAEVERLHAHRTTAEAMSATWSEKSRLGALDKAAHRIERIVILDGCGRRQSLGRLSIGWMIRGTSGSWQLDRP